MEAVDLSIVGSNPTQGLSTLGPEPHGRRETRRPDAVTWSSPVKSRADYDERASPIRTDGQAGLQRHGGAVLPGEGGREGSLLPVRACVQSSEGRHERGLYGDAGPIDYQILIGPNPGTNCANAMVGSAGFDRITSDGGREALRASPSPNV